MLYKKHYKDYDLLIENMNKEFPTKNLYDTMYDYFGYQLHSTFEDWRKVNRFEGYEKWEKNNKNQGFQNYKYWQETRNIIAYREFKKKDAFEKLEEWKNLPKKTEL